MSHLPAISSSFLHALIALDLELVEDQSFRSCHACLAKTHRADYPRRPRFRGDNPSALKLRRRSRCCGNPRCRRRQRIPSVLYMDRRLFLFVQVLFAMARREAAPPQRSTISDLAKELGAHPRTIMRWSSQLRETLQKSRWWRALSSWLPISSQSALLRCVDFLGGFEGQPTLDQRASDIWHLAWPFCPTAIKK